MKEKIYYVLMGLILGSIITLLIMSFPRIRYDLNDDGEVNVLDATVIVKYILED